MTDQPTVRRPQTRREVAALRKLHETGAIPIIVDNPDAPAATTVPLAPAHPGPSEVTPRGSAPGSEVSAGVTAERQNQAELGTDDAGTRQPIARGSAVTKVYGTGSTQVRALDGVDVEFFSGELTAIMGPSGSGKSTLMHCMAGLDTATQGTIWVDGMTVSGMSQRELTKLRRNHIGFVFQAYNLVPTLTAAENITLPLDLARSGVDRAWFDEVVTILGLGDRLRHRPAQLSGGQQQRVAVARALISRPAVIFADEPTGNLDSASAAEVLGFLRAGADSMNQSIVIVTHDPKAASYAHRVVFLADGRVAGELVAPSVETILDRLRDAS